MIIDKRLEFTASATVANGLVGDVIDTEVARDIGHGTHLYLHITALADGGGSGTVKLALLTDDRAAVRTDRTPLTSVEVKGSAIKAGGRIAMMAVPAGDWKRYVGLAVTVTGSVTGAPKIAACLTCEQAGWAAFADAVN